MNVRLTWMVTIGVVAFSFLAESGAAEPKVLLLTTSQRFQHPVVAHKDGKLGLAEQVVVDLGKKHGFDVAVTKDGGVINADELKKYDILFFYTQGNLDEAGKFGDPPVKTEHRQAIVDFVKAGGGFVGTHCGGADTFHNWQPFLEMVGGEFIGHGKQQVSRVTVVDAAFPAVKGWPASFTLNDEWYSYRGFGPKMHVLMMLQTEGMEGAHYNRESYPITWCKYYGKGRVFYTGMGHREDVWTNALYQGMVAKAVLWAAGGNGDASPNLESLFGDVDKALVRINPPKQ